LNDDDLDIALELVTVQHQAMVRSKRLLEPCPYCHAFPSIEAKDVYGYPRATGMTHAEDCPDYVPE
jgi:hypothetical protein